jgi:hypothetical protein
MLFSSGFKGIIKQLEEMPAGRAAEMQSDADPPTERSASGAPMSSDHAPLQPVRGALQDQGPHHALRQQQGHVRRGVHGLIKGEIEKVSSVPTPQVQRDRGRGAMSRWVMKQIAMDWNNKRLPLPPRNAVRDWVAAARSHHDREAVWPLKVGIKKKWRSRSPCTFARFS